jgi:hypothetical protein
MSLSNGGKMPLDKPTFRRGLGKLEACGLKNLDDSPFVDRLFTLLDTNGDGTVDLQEFVTGLSLLCKGTVEEKLECTFRTNFMPHAHLPLLTCITNAHDIHFWAQYIMLT